MKITIQVLGIENIKEKLRDMARRGRSAKPAWRQVAQVLKAESMRCFKDQEAPDGTPWEPLSDATLLDRAYRRTRSMSAKLRKK